MDRGHDAALNAEVIVQDLGQRSKAVSGAGCVRDDVVLLVVVILVIHTNNEGAILVLRRSGDDDLLGATVNVGLGLGCIDEEAGGLDDDIDTEIAPRKISRVALSENLDFLAINDDGALCCLDGAGEAAHDRIVLQQVSKSLGVGEVVDGHNFQIGALLLESAEEVASDAAEAVNANANSHSIPPSVHAHA